MSESQVDRVAVPRRRYSSKAFPPYSYVPGRTPHPLSDPRGHMHGECASQAAALDPDQWDTSDAYLYGLDLFNYGYYWEAHEAWEGLWHAAGRRGPAANWIKGLIKLAAAGVKAREGNPAGARRHALRAKELFAERGVGPDHVGARFCGLSVAAAIAAAERLALGGAPEEAWLNAG